MEELDLKRNRGIEREDRGKEERQRQKVGERENKSKKFKKGTVHKEIQDHEKRL